MTNETSLYVKLESAAMQTQRDLYPNTWELNYFPFAEDQIET